MSFKNAFTLAEVLITLGIIGVVAAMTMPTLINKTNGAQYKAAFKKSLSALSQAGTLNYELDGWGFSDVGSDAQYNIDFSDPSGPPKEGFQEIESSGGLRALCDNRMKVVKSGLDSIWSIVPNENDQWEEQFDLSASSGFDAPYVIHFADGISLIYNANVPVIGTDLHGSHVRAFVDVNGEKGPNKIVKCDEAYSEGDNCVVSSPTDVYPIILKGTFALPASPAAKAVLYGK